jgi:hypothetical protein
MRALAAAMNGAADPFGRNIAINRWREEISLPEPAAYAAQQIGLLIGLDAFDDHGNSQFRGDAHQTFNDRQPRTVGRKALHECAVDLDDVDRHREQVGERGETGAEIIQRNTKAARPE